MAVLRRELPRVLERLGEIHDGRNPRKCSHKLTVLLLYGLLMFVFQFASRREVNREMTRAQFEANLRLLFPKLETLPHADTLFRLLRDIDVSQIEQAHIALLQRLIRAKKFRRYLINNCYPIAIDASQKFARDSLWDENLLQRNHGKGENRHTQYLVYILEASLSFRNGMVIPLLSEFLEYAQGDTDHSKQDCEQRAWGERRQRFFWVNAIDYEFTQAGRKRLSLHVVVCEESWQAVDDEGQIVTKAARHAGLSSRPLRRRNVHERCNLGARHRWGIEAGFLVEKHQGYHYEHAFALDWNAMKGYHYLMRMAHLFNTLARFARHLKALYAELGVRGAIAFIRQSCAAPWLDPEQVRARLSQPFQLQLE